METLSERLPVYLHWAPLLVLGLIFINYIIGVIKAIKSPLSRIPGPWYAPLTTLHLNYAFARETIWKSVEKSHAQYGPIFRLGPRQVWSSDKEAIKTILMTVDLPKVTMYAEISRDRTSPRLFGEMWMAIRMRRFDRNPHKRLKKFLSPAFTIAYVDGHEFLFAKCVGDLINRYVDLLSCPSPKGEKAPVVTDLMEDLHSLALDMKLKLEFDENTWRTIPTAIFKGMTRRYQFVYIKRLLRRLGLNIEFDWPREMIAAISAVAGHRKATPKSVRPDLLQHLLENGERPDSGVKMGTREVVDQMAEILLAGSETTSGTIACFFLEILRNPETKDKLMKSLPILHPSDPIIPSKTVRTSPEYEYLEACIKEVLHLHQIASEMGHPKYWNEPLRFWPERWLDPRPSGVPAPDMQAYYPFSAGKHSCIGKNFAMAEIRILIANIFSRFDLAEVPGQNIDYRQYITMQFEKGSWKAFLTPRYQQSHPVSATTA
ncbi:cytochrome P450 [Aspergillus neoniger CBS 115656]|uniref:Cytochrome P450 n=1 Tax=Aspergillus neoniger (strain CBS 115656) TaxID=1448310 RepID=A0A318Z2K3_ASPNB|nr:cytochrome P450 [Aspergillus neoniger CBS 115656]PYH34398.1 cytochrome P450 [Aspergillus neoniger CBS 115656]